MMVLEAVPPRLRGELTRWLLEVQAGVFIGDVTALVRDRLWNLCLQDLSAGRCCQAWPKPGMQGLALRLCGDEQRSVVDLEGYLLIAVRNARHLELSSGREVCPDEP